MTRVVNAIAVANRTQNAFRDRYDGRETDGVARNGAGGRRIADRHVTTAVRYVLFRDLENRYERRSRERDRRPFESSESFRGERT